LFVCLLAGFRKKNTEFHKKKETVVALFFGGCDNYLLQTSGVVVGELQNR